MVESRSGFHIGFASDLGISPAPPLVAAVLQRDGQMWVCAPVEAPRWCSRPCHGDVLPGWHLAGRAGTAPPCRLDTRLGEW
jgi:hypothetical protein